MDIPDDIPLTSTDQLAIYLGGSYNSFTGIMLGLIAKADPGNKARIATAFPELVRAYDVWYSLEPAPTWATLKPILDAPLPEPLISDSELRISPGSRAMAASRDWLERVTKSAAGASFDQFWDNRGDSWGHCDCKDDTRAGFIGGFSAAIRMFGAI